MPPTPGEPTIQAFYQQKLEDMEADIRNKERTVRRLEAQCNELNSRVSLLREELQLLLEPGSYIGEVVKAMGKTKVLVKVGSDGKFVVNMEKHIDVQECTPNRRVALRNDAYVLHKALPTSP